MSVQTKTSFGIILCRKNVVTLRPEVLLVHKRYTYAFAEFVHGRYSRPPQGRDAKPGAGVAHGSIVAILDGMSREELLDVYSLNFEQMWYRIWLSHDNRDLYNKKNARFQSTFMRDDGGAALRALVLNARGGGILMWEVPKGRRLGTREPDIICAVRELREETGVEKDEYRIIPGVQRHTSYISNGVRYTGVYFIAVANPALSRASSTSVGFTGAGFTMMLREIHNLAEISEVRWQDIERIRMLDGEPSRLLQLIRPAIRLVQNFYAGKIAERRHSRNANIMVPEILSSADLLAPARVVHPLAEAVQAPRARAPDARAPLTCAPLMRAPLARAPLMRAPDLRAPLMRAPDLRAPDLRAPDVQAPLTRAPDVRAPDVRVPDVQAPLMRAPEVRAPDLRAPDVRAPEVQAPALLAPVKTTVVKPAPVKSAPVKPAPVKPAPVKTTVVKPAPVKTTVVKLAPVQIAPVQATPVHPKKQIEPAQSWRAIKQSAGGAASDGTPHVVSTAVNSSEWCTIISRRHAKSMRGARAHARARVLVDMQVPSSIETISDAIINVGKPNWRTSKLRNI